ncbi:MAG: DsbA family protein [Sporolactobacillus sp.]
MRENGDGHRQPNEAAKVRNRKRMILLFSSGVIVLFIAAIFFMGYSAMQKNRAALHKKMETHRVSQTTAINYSNQPFIGSTDVPVRLAIFTDYRCPYCKTFDLKILPAVIQKYVNANKASIYFFNDVILGPLSNLAANAAEEVYEQNPKAFFDFNQALFKAQEGESKPWLTKKLLMDIAEKEVPSLDSKAFQNALNINSRQRAVDNDNQIAEELGVSGTPTVLIDGKPSEDALDLHKLERDIDKALKQKDH